MNPKPPHGLTPRLRFPEFRDAPEWSEKQLEDVLSLIVRQRKKPENPYTGLGVRSHGKGTFLKNLEIPEKNSMEYLYEVQSDDLIVNITFAWEGAIAIVQQTDAGALVSHRFPTYTFKRDVAIPEFFQYIIVDKQFIYKLGVISPGGAGRNRVLNRNDFLKLTALLPDIDEQQKIADCLTSLDDLIAAHRQKLAALRAYKQGLLQHLFPVEGETLPRLRFPEFQDAPEWEEKRLQDISEINPKREKLADEDLVSFVPMSSVSEDGHLIDHQVRAFSEVKKGFTFFRDRDIIFAKITPCFENGKAALLGGLKNGVGLGSTEFHVIRVNEACLPEFLFAYLYTDKVRRLGKSAMTGSAGQQRVPSVFFEDYSISLPERPEQQKIADFLTALDDLIAAQSQKLAALTAHKKGLLQQLFPAPDAGSKM